jgi:hypothetical protein
VTADIDARPGDGRDESPNERADRNWNELLQELRVTQTGTQLISGFLLAVAFQTRFTTLDRYQLSLYLVLVGLAAASTLLGLALVTAHRTHFARLVKRQVVKIGSRLLMANIVVVILLTAGVTSLIFDVAWNRTAGVIAFVVALLFGAGLWLMIIPDGKRPSPVRE